MCKVKHNVFYILDYSKYPPFALITALRFLDELHEGVT